MPGSGRSEKVGTGLTIAGRVLAVTTLAIGCAHPCAAQAARAVSANAWAATLGASAASVALDDYLRAGVTGVAATLSNVTDRARGSLEGSVSRFETGHVTAYAGAGAALRLDARPSTSMWWDVEAGGGAYRGAGASAFGTTGPRVVRDAGAHTQLWAAGGIGRAGDVITYGTSNARIGTVTRFDDVQGATTARVVHAPGVTYTDVTGSIDWTPHRAASTRTRVETMGITAGTRAGDTGPGVRQWLQERAVVRIVPSVALVLAHGAAPPDLLRASRGVNYTSVGIELRFGAARPTLLPPVGPTVASAAPARFALSGAAADGTRTLTIRMSDVASLEVAGDFTGWRPVRMLNAGRDLWSVNVILAPGVHRANVRTSGGDWETIPTLPVAAGDFGPVSVLVVQ